MNTATAPVDEIPSSPDTDETTTPISEPWTPLIRSGETSPDSEVVEDPVVTMQKKKKKKKPKKSAKAKEAAALKAKAQEAQDAEDAESRPPVLCISRNKHWRYISSYHGPWLQLPLELLESLLVLNMDPTTLTASPSEAMATRPPPPLLPPPMSAKSRSMYGLGDFSPPDSPRSPYQQQYQPPPFPPPNPGKATPPPIDPGVFRSVTSIRSLIDEAAELSVRASSGLSAAELGSMRGASGLNNSPWAAAQSLGFNPLGNNNSNGRNVAMSAMRIHRLRALAVQKLAQAYKTDEVASSVMVMQGGSVFDDLAERILKTDPNNADAKYVHFFHEKIPSRQLAESTTPKVLDELIAAHPQHLEYYRTRGIVHCFRDEYPQATKDFTYALKEARAARKAKMMHRSNSEGHGVSKNGKWRKGSRAGHTNGQAPPDGTSSVDDCQEGSELLLHPSVLADAPDPIEPQLLFLRGAAYLQQAIHMIEGAILKLENIHKAPSVDGAELRLCYIENGKYGGVEIGNPDGPLGSKAAPKLTAYRAWLGEKEFREQVTQLLKRSLRDHEKFQTHFDSLDSPNVIPPGDIAFQTEYAFLLSESIRPGNHANIPPPINPEVPAMFTTYHPLLVESHFSVLICMLMLADLTNILPTFIRTAALVDGLEGYPVFLPPRSMGQAEFIEVLERLAGGWRNGVQPHSLSNQRGKGRLAIDAPPVSPSRLVNGSGTLSASSSSSSFVLQGVNGSSSSSMLNGQLHSDAPKTNGHTEHHEEDQAAEPLRPDAAEALDCARILLAPVYKRQRERAEKAAMEKNVGGKKKPIPINIPLHGPRVEIILAWLGAVHLPELDV